MAESKSSSTERTADSKASQQVAAYLHNFAFSDLIEALLLQTDKGVIITKSETQNEVCAHLLNRAGELEVAPELMRRTYVLEKNGKFSLGFGTEAGVSTTEEEDIISPPSSSPTLNPDYYLAFRNLIAELKGEGYAPMPTNIAPEDSPFIITVSSPPLTGEPTSPSGISPTTPPDTFSTTTSSTRSSVVEIAAAIGPPRIPTAAPNDGKTTQVVNSSTFFSLAPTTTSDGNDSKRSGLTIQIPPKPKIVPTGSFTTPKAPR